MELDDGDLLFVKNLASLHEHFRTHREGMMDALFYAGRFVDRLLAFAEQYVVVANVEARHNSIAEPA